jgi:hypothetical protein
MEGSRLTLLVDLEHPEPSDRTIDRPNPGLSRGGLSVRRPSHGARFLHVLTHGRGEKQKCLGYPQGPDLRLGDVRLGEPSESPELRSRLLPKSRRIRGATGLYAMNFRAWEPGQSPVATRIHHNCTHPIAT